MQDTKDLNDKLCRALERLYAESDYRLIKLGMFLTLSYSKYLIYLIQIFGQLTYGEFSGGGGKNFSGRLFPQDPL